MLHAVPPSEYFCFLDLVSLYVISQLRKRKVAMGDIRRGSETLAEQLETPFPFAHQQLATVGTAFFGKLSRETPSWHDVGRRGQGAFQSIIRDALKPIEYGGDGLATIWRPAEGIWINPNIQTGSPCIEGTRVPTRVVAGMVTAGDSPEEIAHDFSVDIDQVKAALAYELAA